MRGLIFLPHICFVEYICKWKLRNWEALEFLKAKKFRCMWRSPFAPLPNFLNHEMVYKDSIWRRKWSQPPLQPSTRQNELCTTMAWLGMTSKEAGPTQGRPFQSNTCQTHCGSSALLARVAFACLALPCLALPCLALPVLPYCHRVRVQFNTQLRNPAPQFLNHVRV